MEDDEDIQQWDKNYDLADEDKVYYGSDSTSFDESSEESEDNDYDKVGEIGIDFYSFNDTSKFIYYGENLAGSAQLDKNTLSRLTYSCLDQKIYIFSPLQFVDLELSLQI